MNIQQAYNAWAATYDTVRNHTRDLEARALRAMVPAGSYSEVLELGCGTGKNTAWLATRAAHVTAVDFSSQMLEPACTPSAGCCGRIERLRSRGFWKFFSSY